MSTALFPLLYAGMNRKWRGEGQVPRWAWYTFMTILAFVVRPEPLFAGLWLAFLLGYAVFPWQAMFSAVDGTAPARIDPWYSQWMQTFALGINKVYPGLSISWHNFGIIYGAIRALTMVPSIVLFCLYFHSWQPLVGLLFLFMGYVYFLGGCLSRYWITTSSMGVVLSEIFMGWALCTYLFYIGG